MIAVLADDLTSALDGAGPFAERGLSVRVVLHEAGLSTDADVVSFDLDSRFLPSAGAEARFARAARQVAGASIIYKTVDSTLRGNLGPEVKGALMGSGRVHAVVAPAFPAAGRTTVGGHQFVGGLPLESTAFAHDPRTPVTSGKVVDHLQGVNPSLFTIYDATHDDALDALVAVTKLDADVVWVGSPGLGAALARAVPPRHSSRPARWQTTKRVLVVIGSLHAANAEQAEHLRSSGAELVEMKALGETSYPRLIAKRIRDAFARSDTACLISPRDLVCGGANAAEQLAAIVTDLYMEFDGLVVTGGDTARRIADALKATAIKVVGEVEPGVPYGVLQAPGRDVAFITKAGGFGASDTLQRCIRRLRG
jgi:uncharacterized protein YgbK (DUF1537 family)